MTIYNNKSTVLDLSSLFKNHFLFLALQFKDETRCGFETPVHCSGS